MVTGKIHENSDIDIGISGLPPQRFFKVYAHLDKELSNRVDLVDFDFQRDFYNLLNSLGEVIELGLEKAFVSNESRKAIFPKELQESMEEYLKFRHFIRHTYGFQLEWTRMENLVKQIENMWKILKENLSLFIV
ncbi:MAG: nucleotidyltransferase domain-containing protein [Treponema sp.]|jgi:predicted nucleotidyltransferase|nr:nucleotidyltransferase domain-containing protein [Treponema sp.]